ncbi:MAG: ABC transporter substrate-binding protein, partial [Burkholderiaceae bacterium]
MGNSTSALLRSSVKRGRRAVTLLLSAVAAVSVFGVQPLRAQETIKFGAPLPITGPLAPEALKQQQGYDLWANQVNRAGGINVAGKKMKVEIVYVDYQSNTPRAVQATERLITQDNV